MSFTVGRLLMHDSKVRLGEPRHPHDGHVVEVIEGPIRRSSRPEIIYYKVTCHDCAKKARDEFYTFETREDWLSPMMPESELPTINWEDDATHHQKAMLVALTALAAALDYVDPVEAAVKVMEDPEMRGVPVTPDSLRLVIERMKEG